MARVPNVAKAVAQVVKPAPISPVAAIKILYHQADNEKNRREAKAAANSIDQAIAAKRKLRETRGW